eukprot:1719531-Amphidinium_carterae.1
MSHLNLKQLPPSKSQNLGEVCDLALGFEASADDKRIVHQSLVTSTGGGVAPGRGFSIRNGNALILSGTPEQSRYISEDLSNAS